MAEFLPKERVHEFIVDAFVCGATVVVHFQKRGDGATRVMQIAPVPREQVRGGAGRDIDAKEPGGTAFVWDVGKQKPAEVPLESVTSIFITAHNSELEAMAPNDDPARHVAVDKRKGRG